MRRRWLFLAALPLLLAVLVLLLLLAESAAPEATIVSVPTALWYLLTTLTTVGYGDCYPVTVLGKLVGAVFQLLSLGLLGLLIGLLAALFSGRTAELLRLARLQKRKWYLFSEKNEAALCLADALGRQEPESVCLFAGSRGSVPQGRGLSLSAEELCRRKRDGNFCLFCIGPSDAENERLADSVEGGRVCCRSAALTERRAANRQRFDPAVLCARGYWERFPLRSAQERVFLIGSGPWAEALLEQALLQNVLDPAQSVHYWVAGDFGDFLRCRPRLEQALELDPACGGRDTLTVLEHWNEDGQALCAADRIILCDEDEDSQRRTLDRLRRGFALRGVIHARLSAPAEGAVSFGAARELYTPELVLQQALDRRAVRLHQRYRSANPAAPAWEELSSFLYRSNLAAADHMTVKLRLLGQQSDTPEACRLAYERFAAASAEEKERFRRIEHARWQRFYLLNGWRCGPKKDGAAREHPMLRPFDQLRAEEQQKDDHSWELLKAEGEEA